MRLPSLLTLSVENLGRRKGRAFMTAIGVVIGTAAIVVLVSLGMGLQRSASYQFGNIGELTQIQVMPNWEFVETVSVASTGPGGPSGPSVPQIVITDNTLAQIAQFPHVEGVYPRDYLQSGYIQVGRLEGWTTIMGIERGTLEAMGVIAEQGGLPLEHGTVVVGYAVPQNLYDPRPRPGQDSSGPPDLFDQTLKIILSKYSSEGVETRKTVQARVTGVLAESRGESDWSIYMSLVDVESYNQWIMGRKIDHDKEGYPLAIITVDEVSQVIAVADQINELGFLTYTPQSYIQGINGFYLMLQIIFGGIGAISLFVAALGIANTMTMAIMERIREIGLMKAVGATNRDVLGIFLGEAAGIGLFGGIGGVVLGWSVSQVVNLLGLVYMAQQSDQMGGMAPVIASYTPPWLLGFALLFAVLVGILSGLYPALKAATMIPVVALRYE